ncbi:MAG: hypothetical protein ACP5HC_09030 [Caldisericum sp.]
MDKKEINDLIKQRNKSNRDFVKPVDLFDSKSVNSQEDTIDSGSKDPLVKYTTYLPEDLIIKIKIKSALTKQKSYQIIKQALEEFFEKNKD